MPKAFPGYIIRQNSTLSDAVQAIQERLNKIGCGPVEVDGIFGPKTSAAVRLFQTRFSDVEGNALKADGEVGPVTWAALFGSASVPDTEAGDELARAAVITAESQIGIFEKPLGSNRGAEVEEYLASVGLQGGNPWCAAFVYWCTARAAKELEKAHHLPRTGSVLSMWRRAKQNGLPIISATQAISQPTLLSTGMIFAIDHGGGLGHTGFVESTQNGKLITIEGNTNDGSSREGTGVFRLNRRTISTINLGFIGLK